MVSSGLMVTNTGLSGRDCSGAVLAGRLTPISTVASGAATIKMMSSTRMTSMNGVTLISCWISRSSSPEREPRRIAIVSLRSARQRSDAAPVAAAYQQKELRRGVAQQSAVTVDHARKMVVDHDCRNGRDQPERSGQQGLCDAGRDHREIGSV